MTDIREDRGVDAVNLITIYLILLFCVPANLIISPLGASGTPAQSFGLIAGGWWLAAKLAGGIPAKQRRDPIKPAMMWFTAAILASYIAAMVRPIDPIEISAADRGILQVLSWFGIFAMTADCIPSKPRLDALLRRMVLLGGLLATLGIVQFLTNTNWVDQIAIPGLTPNLEVGGLFTRSGFARPSGTATHPIEFGVVIAMILPIALHYAFTDVHRSSLRRWYPVVAIAFAIPISISRSAIVATLVVLALTIPTWPKGRRRASYAAMAAFGVAVYVTVPGLIGTLGGLFTGIAQDGSAASRTDSYGVAWFYISNSPFVGRGLGTFLPAYRILDNQYVLLMIEIGLVGVLILLALFGLGVLSGVRTRMSAPNVDLGNVAQALSAAVAAGACSFATFDAFAFPLVSNLMFVTLGLVFAASRVSVTTEADFAPTTLIGVAPPRQRIGRGAVIDP